LDKFDFSRANITRASNGQIDSAPEPGYRQNRRPSQPADVAGVMLPWRYYVGIGFHGIHRFGLVSFQQWLL